MPAYDGSLNFNTRVDSRGFNRGVSSISSTVKKLGGLLATVFAVKVLVNFGKQAIQLASDLQEVQNVVDTVFGSMAQNINAFSKTALEEFGLSELSAKRYASTLGAMGASMGVSSEQNLEMSKTLTGLIGDYASFYNISADRAATALKAIYTGETESLKLLGKVITEVNLQEFARTKGITKSITAMTQQEKVMLRYNYILEGSKNETSDFLRTQDSWANQTRILTERWKQFLGLIGNNLINVFTPVLKVLNKLIAFLISATNQFNAFYEAVTGKQIKQQSGVSGAIDESADSQDGLTDSIKGTNKELKKSLAGFDDINVLQEKSAADVSAGLGLPVTGGGIDINTGVEDSTEKLGKVYETLVKINTFANVVKENFLNLFNSISARTKPVTDAIVSEFGSIANKLKPILDQIFKEFLPVLGKVFKVWVDIFGEMYDFTVDVFANIYNVAIRPILDLIIRIVSETLDILIKFWEKYAVNLYESIRESFKQIYEIFNFVLNTLILPVVTNVLLLLTDLWDNHLKQLVEAVATLLGELYILFMEITNNVILPFINFLVQKFGPRFKIAFDFVANVTRTTIGLIADLITSLIEIFTGIVQFISGVFSGDWEKAWQGLSNILKGILNGIVGMFNGMINFVIDGINLLTAALNQIDFDVPDWVPGLGGKSFGINIPKVPPVNIPRLATGAVIPPNSEFMAVLGDQKQHTNIEAPLPTIIDAMNTALRNNGPSNEVVIKFTGELAELARILKPEMEKENKRTGQRVRVVTV